MSCLASNPKTTSCTAKSQIGGLRPTVWALNLNASDGTKLSYTKTGNTISAITVQSGLAAYRIDGEKFAHDLASDGVKNDGGNVYYQPTLNIRSIVDTDADITWLDDMVKATNLVFIVEKPNNTFLVVGQDSGLSYLSGTINEGGQTADSNIASLLGFQGQEINPSSLLDVGTGYEDTLNYIIGLETPAP